MRNFKTIVFSLAATALLAHGCGGSNKTLNDYESWPPGLSVPVRTPVDKLIELKKAGFDYVEVKLQTERWTSQEERLEVIEDFRANANQAGITVWSVHMPYDVNEWDPSTLDEQTRLQCVEGQSALIEMVAILKPHKLILHASSEPIAEEERDARLRNSVRSINEIAPYASAIGAQLLIEDLPRTCLGNTSAEMHRILSLVDPAVGVCFDTNHLLNETPHAFAGSMGERIASLHVSDYDAVDEKHWLMGRGCIDWPELAGILSEIGYKGVFMFEVNGYKSYEEVMETWWELHKKLSLEK